MHDPAATHKPMRQDDKKNHVFVARQPIYDIELEVYGYELLYRGSGGQAGAQVEDADLATSQVMLNTYMEIGLERLVGLRKAFINIPRSFIDGSLDIPLSKRQVVLEVLEDVAPDAEVIAGLEELAKRGFALALDDFIYHESLEPLIELADLIKLDIQQVNRDELQHIVRKLKKRGVRLLAEKIETQEEFQFCKGLGFDYFQGYFLARPSLISKKKLPNNKLVNLQLLGRLQEPDVSFEELGELVSKDPSLSIKLLNYINSPVFGLAKPVSSIYRALELLGLNTLKRWVAVLVLFGLSDKPSEVFRTALIRAKLCESIAERLNRPNADEYFVLGLFSLLDVLLDNTMEEVLGLVKLPGNLAAALLAFEGEEGEVLAMVLAYEQADWEAVASLGLAEDVLTGHYLDALQWAEEAMVDI